MGSGLGGDAGPHPRATPTQVEWHEPSTLRPDLDLKPEEEGDNQPPIHLLLELVDVSKAKKLVEP